MAQVPTLGRKPKFINSMPKYMKDIVPTDLNNGAITLGERYCAKLAADELVQGIERTFDGSEYRRIQSEPVLSMARSIANKAQTSVDTAITNLQATFRSVKSDEYEVNFLHYKEIFVLTVIHTDNSISREEAEDFFLNSLS